MRSPRQDLNDVVGVREICEYRVSVQRFELPDGYLTGGDQEATHASGLCAG